MNFLLDYGVWIVPPLVGALIGYVTNTLAVKMLFRPHKKWKLGKLSLPLTPGVIPRNRDELSQNIAEITANQLLNPDTLEEQLSSSNPALSSSLEKSIEEKIQKKIQDFREKTSNQRTQNSFTEKLPTELQSPFVKLYSSTKTQVKKFLSEWLASPQFHELLREEGPIPKLFQTFFQKFFREGIPAKKLEKLLKLFIPEQEPNPEDTNEKSVSKTQTEIESQTESQIESLLASPLFQEPLKDWIPQDIIPFVLEIIEEAYPSILQKLKKTMIELEMEKEFFFHLRFIFVDYIKSLNIAQQFLVGVWGVEERIEKDLPQLIDQAIESIFDSVESRKRDIFNWLTKEITALLDRPLKDFSNSITENRMMILQRILRDPKVMKFLSQILQEFFRLQKNSKVDSKPKTVDLREFSDEMIEGLLSFFAFLEEQMDSFVLPSTISLTISSAISPSIFSSEKSNIPLDSKTVTSEETSYSKSDSDSISKEISRLLTQEILASLQKKSFWESFPIQKIVQKKMEEFSTKEIETLLLKIMQKHFKWIYLLGAILGFLIGALQLL